MPPLIQRHTASEADRGSSRPASPRIAALARALGMVLWISVLLGIGCATSSPQARVSRVGLTGEYFAAPGTTFDAVIQAHALQSGFREFSVTRMLFSGDVDGDGVSDPLCLYRLDDPQGSGAFRQFLILRSASLRGGVIRVQVGGDSRRSATLGRVRAGLIEVLIQEYLPGDASCCPTGHGVLRWMLEGRQLREVPLER